MVTHSQNDLAKLMAQDDGSLGDSYDHGCAHGSTLLDGWRDRLRRAWEDIPGDLDGPVLVRITSDPLVQSMEPPVLATYGPARLR